MRFSIERALVPDAGVDELFMETDDDLLERIFSTLQQRVTADPSGDDGAFAEQIRGFPVGLRAMAATQSLDVSMSIDSLFWHFLNFGEPGHVDETLKGFSELGLDELAAAFREASRIMAPLLPEIAEGHELDEVLQRHGFGDRSEQLEQIVGDATSDSSGPLGSAIYAAWVRYAREHPEQVFDAAR